MPAQSYTIGQEPGYRELPRTTRAPGNAAQAPKVVRLAAGELRAEVECNLVGRYDRSGAVNEREVFRLSHDIPGERATLEVQRFVKAVRVQGTQFFRTAGTGYLHWGEGAVVPEGRGVQALCASQLRTAGLQDDGPRGTGKVVAAPDAMAIEIRDSPGMAASRSTDFPYALLADFIMRIIVRPRSGEPEAAVFRYQAYFELERDPYPAGMRGAAFVPQTAGYNDYRTFSDIAARFRTDQHENARPAVPQPAGRSLVAGRGAVRGMPGRASATTDDLAPRATKKTLNDMY